MRVTTFVLIIIVSAVVLTALSPKNIIVTSPVFKEKDDIPMRYTCEGQNINPPLMISTLPERTKTLALIMDDPDAVGGTFDHWVVWNIPVGSDIKENSNPGSQGKNGAGKIGYTGPCPPHGTGTHHYNFQVYALDTSLDLVPGSSRKDLEKAMKGHVLAKGKLTGLYKKATSMGVK